MTSCHLLLEIFVFQLFLLYFSILQVCFFDCFSHCGFFHIQSLLQEAVRITDESGHFFMPAVSDSKKKFLPYLLVWDEHSFCGRIISQISEVD